MVPTSHSLIVLSSPPVAKPPTVGAESKSADKPLLHLQREHHLSHFGHPETFTPHLSDLRRRTIGHRGSMPRG